MVSVWITQYTFFSSSPVSPCCSSTPPHTVSSWSSSSAQVRFHFKSRPACQSARTEARKSTLGVRGQCPARNTSASLFILLGLNHNAGSEIGCERPPLQSSPASFVTNHQGLFSLQRSKFKEVWALINLFPLCFPIPFVGGKNVLYLKEISLSPG